ncbi:diacylglycerol/lipid kinase family protein [Ruminococcus flavefaciens]|uniref:Lipid kinase, YegS/Rv2252/BmrU family n=1 Tax=Ruminococcus flavefaciens TaxID=1265 RepID=A0A1M7LDJ7_RUMFL|nr:YegS/Rv2252/BmrU family lipid kinase [Ruminococcus flavefaciens]SHM76186.1 lipid kinase, YegS/Rv2252/BmrU family [Ruminococcus flavefaciens]
MKKIYFIVNLVAGKAVISKKLGKIIDEFVKNGYEVTVHTTQSGDDAVEQAVYACENGFDKLVVAGGDGTLSQCLQGVMGSNRRIPIGYVPAGSTNDFAKSLGIPSDQLKAAVVAAQGEPVFCDVGGFNDRYFSYVAAFGAFTNITYETSQKVKNVFGHAAYIADGAKELGHIKAKPMRIEYEDMVIEGDFVYGMVTNTSSVAGMIKMKDFLLDDGIFEVTLIRKPRNPAELGKTALSLLKNDMTDKNIIFFRTNKVTITNLSDEPFSWTRDGEYGGEEIVNSFCCHKKAVPFVVADKEKLPFEKELV